MTSGEQKRFEDWQLLTQRLRQGRCRIRPEFQRELAAWLLVQQARYQRTLKEARDNHRGDSDPWIQGMIRTHESRIEHINALILQTMDNWRSAEWWEAVNTVEAVLTEAKAGEGQGGDAPPPAADPAADPEPKKNGKR